MTNSRPLRILAFAYACEPDKGSEPGAGWILARLLAGVGYVTVITRANNKETIEAALPDTPERDRLRFEYVDLSPRARFWKRGQRGIRVYYFLWQIAALRRARRLARDSCFDITWHLTLANAWLGSLAPLVGRCFVLGPVGGGVGLPWRLAHSLGYRGVAMELFRATAKKVGRYANPLARLSWRRATLILAQNPDTVAWLPRRHRGKAHVFPHAIIDADRRTGTRPIEGRTALFAGQLLPLKGLALALAALTRAVDWRLIILGDGPDRGRLERLARRRGLVNRVEFRGWQPHQEVIRAMREDADVLLFPSIHDEAPLTVVEALSEGLPVVCLAHGGPPIVADAMGAQMRDGIAPLAELSSALSDAAAMRTCIMQGATYHLDDRRHHLGLLLASWVIPHLNAERRLPDQSGTHRDIVQ